MSDAVDAPAAQAVAVDHSEREDEYSGREDESQPRERATPPKRRLERYLDERAADGEFYFKCKFIAADVDLTPSQIGTYLSEIRDADTAFEVEPWSYSNATTWRVRPTDA